MKTFTKFFLPLVSIILACACGDKEPNYKKLPDGEIRHDRIVVARYAGSVFAKGFKGATPNGTDVFFSLGRSNQSATSDSSNGSFEIEISGGDGNLKFAELSFTGTGVSKTYKERYEVKSLGTQLNKVAKDRLSINHPIVDFSLDQDQIAFITNSPPMLFNFQIDDRFSLKENSKKTMRLGNGDTGPMHVFLRDIFQLTTLGKSNQIHFSNLQHEVLGQNFLKIPFRQKNFVVDHKSNINLVDPIEPMMDGTRTTSFNKSIAFNPNAVFPLDDTHFLISFTNYFQTKTSSKDAKVGVGLVALVELVSSGLTTLSVREMPFKNPLYFFQEQNNFSEVWVACPGPWDRKSGGVYQSSNAGLVKLKIARGNREFYVNHKIDLKNFSPAQPAFSGDEIVIPKSFSNQVLVLKKDANNLNNGNFISLSGYGSIQFTFAEQYMDDIVFLGENRGRLIAFSKKQNFFPFPFVDPINLHVNKNAKHDLSPAKITFRDKVDSRRLGVDYQGPNGIVFHSATNGLVLLDFLEVFGP